MWPPPTSPEMRPPLQSRHFDWWLESYLYCSLTASAGPLFTHLFVLFSFFFHVLTHGAIYRLPSYIAHSIPLVKLSQQLGTGLVHKLVECFQAGFLNLKAFIPLAIVRLQLQNSVWIVRSAAYWTEPRWKEIGLHPGYLFSYSKSLQKADYRQSRA